MSFETDAVLIRDLEAAAASGGASPDVAHQIRRAIARIRELWVDAAEIACGSDPVTVDYGWPPGRQLAKLDEQTDASVALMWAARAVSRSIGRDGARGFLASTTNDRMDVMLVTCPERRCDWSVIHYVVALIAARGSNPTEPCACAACLRNERNILERSAVDGIACGIATRMRDGVEHREKRRKP